MTHPPRGPGKELPTGCRDLGIHPIRPSSRRKSSLHCWLLNSDEGMQCDYCIGGRTVKPRCRLAHTAVPAFCTSPRGGSRRHFIQLANRRPVRSSVPYSTCEVLVEFAALQRCGIVALWGRCFAGRRGLGARRSLFIPWRQAVSTPATQNPILGENRQECLRQ